MKHFLTLICVLSFSLSAQAGLQCLSQDGDTVVVRASVPSPDCYSYVIENTGENSSLVYQLSSIEKDSCVYTHTLSNLTKEVISLSCPKIAEQEEEVNVIYSENNRSEYKKPERSQGISKDSEKEESFIQIGDGSKKVIDKDGNTKD